MILGRPAIWVEVQRQYWSLIRAGEVPGDAADAVASRTVTWRWFRNAGGVMPPVERAPDAGSLPFRLTFAEREEIACRRAAGHGVRMIARHPCHNAAADPSQPTTRTPRQILRQRDRPARRLTVRLPDDHRVHLVLLLAWRAADSFAVIASHILTHLSAGPETMMCGLRLAR